MHGCALPVPVGRCSVVWMNDVGCAGATRGPPEAERRGRRERTDVRQAYLVVLVETTAKDCDWPGGRLTHSHLIHSTFQQAPHTHPAHTPFHHHGGYVWVARLSFLPYFHSILRTYLLPWAELEPLSSDGVGRRQRCRRTDFALKINTAPSLTHIAHRFGAHYYTPGANMAKR